MEIAPETTECGQMELPNEDHHAIAATRPYHGIDGVDQP
jgi:hypothetical protein